MNAKNAMLFCLCALVLIQSLDKFLSLKKDVLWLEGHVCFSREKMHKELYSKPYGTDRSMPFYISDGMMDELPWMGKITFEGQTGIQSGSEGK